LMMVSIITPAPYLIK